MHTLTLLFFILAGKPTKFLDVLGFVGAALWQNETAETDK
jgi:hypothetical protein